MASSLQSAALAGGLLAQRSEGPRASHVSRAATTPSRSCRTAAMSPKVGATSVATPLEEWTVLYPPSLVRTPQQQVTYARDRHGCRSCWLADPAWVVPLGTGRCGGLLFASTQAAWRRRGGALVRRSASTGGLVSLVARCSPEDAAKSGRKPRVLGLRRFRPHPRPA